MTESNTALSDENPGDRLACRLDDRAGCDCKDALPAGRARDVRTTKRRHFAMPNHVLTFRQESGCWAFG